MKYLILMLVVAGVLWWLRSSRRQDLPPAPGAAHSPDGPAQHEEMLACAKCGVHLPRSEALPGRGGVFCGEAHRRDFEQEHSRP